MSESSFEKKVAQYEPVDETGMSARQLKWSYFFVTHKIFFRNVAIGIFVFVDALMLGWAVWGFGSYYIVGQPSENAAALTLAQRLATASAPRLAASAATPLVFGDTLVFAGADSRYDFAVDVQNTNAQWYALVTYQFDVAGASSTPSRTTFVLPGEHKFLIDLGEKRPGEAIGGAQFSVKALQWRRLSPHDFSSLSAYTAEHNHFTVTNATFTPGAAQPSGTATGNQITFTIHNDTAYNFWSVPTQIILLYHGVVQGVEETTLDQLRTGESRTVELRNYTQNMTVDDVSVIPSVDVFDQSVYMNQ